MAKISFETFQETNKNSNGNSNQVKLFSLKDHGDEAIVRIMHDSTDDFDIITCHSVKIGNNFRKVSCIRDPRGSVDDCPLCKEGNKIQQRFFIHMIQYVQGEDGSIIPMPVVWERTAREYATKLNTLIEEYGPLSNLIFKIRRNGKAGSMDTTYEILFVNPAKFDEAKFPKIENAFDNYSVIGTVVLDKNAEEIKEFIATGNFPANKNLSIESDNDPLPMVDDSPILPNNTPTASPFETTTTPPWENNSNSSPTRYY